MDEISALDGCELQENASLFHVAHGRAFLGIHLSRGGILVNIVLTRELESERIHRAVRVSANWWHNEVILKDPLGIDAELLGWIREHSGAKPWRTSHNDRHRAGAAGGTAHGKTSAGSTISPAEGPVTATPSSRDSQP